MAREPSNKDAPFYIALKQAHRNIIGYALETADNDWHLACARLGLTQQQFRYYCENLGMPLPDRRRKVGAAPQFDENFEKEAVVDLDNEAVSTESQSQDDESNVEDVA